MENQKSKKSWGAFVIGMVVGLLGALIVTGVIFHVGVKKSEDSFLDSEAREKITELETILHKRFYLSEITDEQLEEGVYRGIIDSLDDPYAEYYTPEELEEMLDQSEGIYYGIGAYLSLDEETQLPKITEVMKGTPAEEADLHAEDLICKVDGKELYGLTLTLHLATFFPSSVVAVIVTVPGLIAFIEPL